ncbi:hypothetical protein FTO68_02510 [Methanocalculus taiwanensis]|uniref:Uncharacterized protein n=1 Tax=Methanocalculus taiwanensis TaxID=106207 RepID=A0ABD4TKQ2_9EURY|nr:hypothetical protein [Methanocalculus taiwanensis]MCQ1537860.1 hypothetical protein [Methanocalculus taiwanensis]
MHQPVRCKGCIIGILGGLLWIIFTYGFLGAIDWTGAVIFAFVLTIISALIAHWRLCKIR